MSNSIHALRVGLLICPMVLTLPVSDGRPFLHPEVATDATKGEYLENVMLSERTQSKKPHVV